MDYEKLSAGVQGVCNTGKMCIRDSYITVHVPLLDSTEKMINKEAFEKMKDCLLYTSNYNISLIPGDGIGPEIVAEAKKVLDKVCEKYGHTFSYSEVLLGGASIDVHGVPLTDEAIATAKASDAVLMLSLIHI